MVTEWKKKILLAVASKVSDRGLAICVYTYSKQCAMIYNFRLHNPDVLNLATMWMRLHL